MKLILSLLGSLPASDSIKGRLNALDWKKTIRSTLIPGVLSYIAVATFEKILSDLAGIGLPSELTNGLIIGLAPVIELLRRKYLSTISFNS